MFIIIKSKSCENNIKLVETRLSYNIYQNEQLLTHSDIKRSFYETLYSHHLSQRLFVLDFFTTFLP